MDGDTIPSTCTAQIKDVNGVKTIESYVCKASRKQINSDVYAIATLKSATKSGMKVNATWKVTTYFPANMVTSTQEVTYSFN